MENTQQYTFEDFEKLMTSDIEEVQQLTNKTLYYKFLFDNKQIDELEYIDLLQNMINLDFINKELMKDEIYSEVINSIKLINTFKKLSII